MIKVTVWMDPQDRMTGFHTEGHAGYAESGYDIICSAVSAIILTTLNSIEELTDDRFHLTQHQESGVSDFRFLDIPGTESILLLRAMLIGLKGIQKEYGTTYLKIYTKEV